MYEAFISSTTSIALPPEKREPNGSHSITPQENIPISQRSVKNARYEEPDSCRVCALHRWFACEPVITLNKQKKGVK